MGGIKLKSSINTLNSFKGPTNNTGGNSIIEAKLKSSGLKQPMKQQPPADPFQNIVVGKESAMYETVRSKLENQTISKPIPPAQLKFDR